MVHISHTFQWFTSHTLSSAGEGRRFEQNVEQARPSDTSEEEMQLKLALQLSKQQADEEQKLRYCYATSYAGLASTA